MRKEYLDCQLSELCDFQGPDTAQAVLFELVGSLTPLQKESAPFDDENDIAGETIEDALRMYGPKNVLRYIYDFAVDELDYMKEEYINPTILEELAEDIERLEELIKNIESVKE